MLESEQKDKEERKRSFNGVSSSKKKEKES